MSDELTGHENQQLSNPVLVQYQQDKKQLIDYNDKLQQLKLKLNILEILKKIFNNC